VHLVPGYVPRFDYPPFALPYRRYTTESILDRCVHFFQGFGVSYRKAMWVGRRRIAYDHGPEDWRQLSHTTLWRWLGWLGGMTVLVAAACKLIRDKDPTVDLFRRPYPLDPRRYRSQQRRQALQNAARLLDAATRFEQLFDARFFTDFGTGTGFT
jgi:hypothetical protein